MYYLIYGSYSNFSKYPFQFCFFFHSHDPPQVQSIFMHYHPFGFFGSQQSSHFSFLLSFFCLVSFMKFFEDSKLVKCHAFWTSLLFPCNQNHIKHILQKCDRSYTVSSLNCIRHIPVNFKVRRKVGDSQAQTMGPGRLCLYSSSLSHYL